MNQREKVLAAGIGLLGALYLGNLFWTSIQSGIANKRQEVATLKKKLEDQELEMLRGAMAAQKISKVTPRSASKNEEHAKAEYQRWLVQLTNQTHLENPSVLSTLGSKGKDNFNTYRFQLRGIGNMGTITELLHQFYSKPFLHRIAKLDLRPAGGQGDKNPDLLTLNMECEFLAIPTAKDVQVPLASDPSIASKPLEVYEDIIVQRNLFSPANNAPRLAEKHSIDAVIGSGLDYSVKAEDSDPHHTITYSLVGTAPEGMTIDSNSGRITWTGKELGEYQFEVQATDSGLPAKSTNQVVTVRVTTPPPKKVEPPKFDIASQAKLTGLVSGSLGAEAWISSLTEEKTHKLRKGDELVLGDVKGKVVDVGANFIEIETDGRKWTIGIEESVADAYQRGMID